MTVQKHLNFKMLPNIKQQEYSGHYAPFYPSYLGKQIEQIHILNIDYIVIATPQLS